MAKQSQKTSAHFDNDLNAILNRVYGKDSDSAFNHTKVPTLQPFARKTPGSQGLKEALDDLRSRRERAQACLRMQDEIDDLREQIRILRELGDQIDRLRQQLAIAANPDPSSVSDAG
ncbi:MAG: hypothetical protein ACUVQI_00855 [Thermochromatium sp.]